MHNGEPHSYHMSMFELDSLFYLTFKDLDHFQVNYVQLAFFLHLQTGIANIAPNTPKSLEEVEALKMKGTMTCE